MSRENAQPVYAIGAFRTVGGATVNLLDGAQAGASTQSDETGRFSFGGIFEDPTTVRVSKEGYAAATGTAKSINSSIGTIWASVVLDVLAKPVDISGDYTVSRHVTVTAYYGQASSRAVPESIYSGGSNLRFAYLETLLRF